MDDISNNVYEILHALDVPFDTYSYDDNCDICLSDELLEGLEDPDVFNWIDTVIENNDPFVIGKTPPVSPKNTNNYNKKITKCK